MESPLSLQEIIIAQEDEPQQRNCIYRLKNSKTASSDSEGGFIDEERFYQIRVKSIDFL